MTNATKIGLGTVQFGLDYGISNAAGRTPTAEVARILAFAAETGIRLLDTACLYGDSEAALGGALPPEGADGGGAFRIVTKTPKYSQGFGAAEADALKAEFRASLGRLKRKSVYGLLAHDADDMLRPGGDRMLASMRELQAEGLVEKVGSSVYSPAQIDSLLANSRIDLVQAPCNVLDQRLIKGGQLRALAAAGVEFHARSVFLQGLLLMPPSEVPAYFAPIRPLLDRFAECARAQGNTPLQAALAFVAERPEISNYLVGVNDLAQLRQIAAADASRLPAGDLAECHCTEERFINPSLWKKA